MWFVYILKCSDNTLYTGITNDLTKRLSCHNEGKASKYTRSRLPVVMMYNEESLDRSEASKREFAIKKMTRGNKLKLIGVQNAKM